MTRPMWSLGEERREDLDSESACRSPRLSLMATPNAIRQRETVFRLWSTAHYRHILAVRLAAVRVGRLGGQGSALQSMAIDQVSGPAPRRRKPQTGRLFYNQDVMRMQASGRRTPDDPIPSPVILYRLANHPWFPCPLVVWFSSVLRRVRTILVRCWLVSTSLIS